MTNKNTEASRRWRAANPEKHRENQRKWYHQNKEKVVEYRVKNKDRLYAKTAKWKKENPDKLRIIERRRLLKRKYGLTLEDFDRLLLAQSNSCAICFIETKLVVDHNHETGEIRGLLCNDCNRNLIAQRNDPEIFLRAAEYLKREKIK